MAKIAYILLCHKDPKAIIAQAERLTATGDYIAIHFDSSARAEDFRAIQAALGDNPNVVFARRRISCGWGEWSLVQASLYAVEAAEAKFHDATHFYMLSGDCMPIKSSVYIHDFLDRNDKDFVEGHDFFSSDWIKTGMKEDRLHYRHFFNERGQKWLFYQSLEWQRRLGLSREVPKDIRVRIGSQWWCLRRRTVEALLDFVRERPDIKKFFKTTWIPDETFFQTLVWHLIPEPQIECRTLTFLLFTDYGMPVNFYDDQYEMLMAQDSLFARKISPEATKLKGKLGALYSDDEAQFAISNEGPRMHAFLTGRGRIGRRYAQRFWEAESSLGRSRELLIVTCKKWHVAKRLLHQIAPQMNLPMVEYLFDEEDTAMPDLGGVESTLAKRTRHRRALVRMLMDHYDTDRLLICLDPKNLDLIQDFYSDRCTTRLLEIECNFTDEYLMGHARRVGLIAPKTPDESIDRLMPTIRYDVVYESERLKEADFPNAYRIREWVSPEENTNALAAFLTLPQDTARKIASADHIYAD
ncbi:DUF5928 domain-containing protein [Actibacterium pelagium]|uniref:Peptide O-xylosyltransferase n=1 Tax=Actibacterium pelagium TaxID=2029103 RepID=A0A917AHX7_9RHOB|nr:DUF5928 domain-containing protein [Actibacterium pelagium]GGE54275.1 glycosyl transferase [Actibacterium pelagium]